MSLGDRGPGASLSISPYRSAEIAAAGAVPTRASR